MKATYCCTDSQESFGLVSQQNNDHNPKFQGQHISKNKNIDHGVKETCVIISTETTYEENHISLLCDSTTSSAPNFCFLCILL